MKAFRKYVHDRYANFLARRGWLRPEQRVSEIIYRVTEAVKAILEDAQFRTFVDWLRRTESEKDFIFNEIAAMAFCGTRAAIVESLPALYAKERAFWRATADALFPEFLSVLRKSGISEDRVVGWGELLALREKEALDAQGMVSEVLAAELRSVHPDKVEPLRRVFAASALVHFQIAKHLHLAPNSAMSSFMSNWMVGLDNAMRRAMR